MPTSGDKAKPTESSYITQSSFQTTLSTQQYSSELSSQTELISVQDFIYARLNSTPRNALRFARPQDLLERAIKRITQ